MTRSNVSKLSFAVMALGVAAGCDSQSSADYQGDPLFRLTGSVEVPPAFEGQDLVPVLLFPDADGEETGRLNILDVGVQGSFPSSFTLDVFDPPPPSALHTSRGGAYAQGFVSAMPPSHPSIVLISLIPVSPGPANLQRKVCALGESRCFTTDLACPSDDYTDDCTILSTSGDAALSEAGWGENLQIIYFPEVVPAGSGLSFSLGNGNALSAGYHLFRMRKPTMTRPPGYTECAKESRDRALADFNEAHGTTFTDTAQVEQDTPEESELVELRQRWEKELGCMPEKLFVEVTDTANSPISIKLGARSPFNFLAP